VCVACVYRRLCVVFVSSLFVRVCVRACFCVVRGCLCVCCVCVSSSLCRLCSCLALFVGVFVCVACACRRLCVVFVCQLVTNTLLRDQCLKLLLTKRSIHRFVVCVSLCVCCVCTSSSLCRVCSCVFVFVRVVALFVGVCVCVARAHRRLCVRINDHHCISIQMFETPIYEAFNSGSCFVRVGVCIPCAHRRLFVVFVRACLCSCVLLRCSWVFVCVLRVRIVVCVCQLLTNTLFRDEYLKYFQ